MLQRSIAALDERKELLISSNDSFGKGGGGGGGSLVPGLSSSAMRKVRSLYIQNALLCFLTSIFYSCFLAYGTLRWVAGTIKECCDR
jgi:hypothetical protein